MAPVSRVDHNALEQQLKDTIQSMHNIMVQITLYDQQQINPSSTSTDPANSNSNNTTTARPSRDVVAAELTTLSSYLSSVHRTATTPSVDEALPHIPPELIQYVDAGRNPDIYTREFVELVRRGNQLMSGKSAAFAGFRDVLAGEMGKAMPELGDDVRGVVAATGGGGGGGEGGTGASAAAPTTATTKGS